MAEETRVHTVHERGESKGRRRRESQRSSEAIIVDLGRKAKRDVDRLRKGRGRLVDDIDDCLADLRQSGDVPESAQPVIILVKERPSLSRPALPLLLPGVPPIFSLGGDDDDDDEEDDDEEDDDEDED